MDKIESIVGEKEFFDFMKRANRDLTSHERAIVMEITVLMIKSPTTFATKKIKIVDREEK